MAQLHSFSNPFDFKQYAEQFKFPMSEEFGMHNFAQWMNQGPWNFSQQLFENYYPLQKKCWDNYWKWANWTQSNVQLSAFETSRWMMHCMQLAPEPNTLFRYLRMNWQKPYLSLSSQSISSTRLLSRLTAENLSFWQAMAQTGENKSKH
jgi:hypothetical protein